MNNYNAIVLYTPNAQDAELVLKRAEHVLRWNWNLYGFQRISSGYETIVTDGFGNPYPGERELKLFGIAIAVPEHMDYRTALSYLTCGSRFINCEVQYHLVNLD